MSLSFSTLTLSVSTNASSVTQQWSNTYGPYAGDSVIKTADGGYLIVGGNATRTLTDYVPTGLLIIKTDSSGLLEWGKTYGEPYNLSGGITEIIQTPDGGYLLSGPYCILKIGAQGDVLWFKTFVSGLAFTPVLEEQAGDGLFIIGKTGWLTKMDLNGNIQWNKILYNSVNVGQVIETSDGSLVLSGAVHNGAGGSDGFLLKSDSGGNVLWVRIFGDNTSLSIGNGLVIQTDSGYLSSGYWGNYYWILETDYRGNVQFNRTYGLMPPIGVSFTFMVPIDKDNCLLTGGGGAYAWLMEIDSSGNIIWSKYYDLDAGFRFGFTSLLPLNDDTAIAATHTTIIHVDASGVVQWSQSFDGDIRSVISTNDTSFIATGQLNNSVWLSKFSLEAASDHSSSISTFPTITIIAPLVISIAVTAIIVMVAVFLRKKKRYHQAIE